MTEESRDRSDRPVWPSLSWVIDHGWAAFVIGSLAVTAWKVAWSDDPWGGFWREVKNYLLLGVYVLIFIALQMVVVVVAVCVAVWWSLKKAGVEHPNKQQILEETRDYLAHFWDWKNRR